jgi:phosphopantetheine--protein transferase-like protein
MVYGIGIDLITVSDVERFLENPEYAADIFTEKELKLADVMMERHRFFASRYAAKSAVWKSVSHLISGELNKKDIEVLAYDDGAPYVVIEGRLKELLEGTGITDIRISITTEGDSTCAIALSQG